jgi:hypothetical protein
MPPSEKTQARRKALGENRRAQAQALLEPGEKIQALFGAQIGANPAFGLISIFIVMFNRHVIIVATDRAVVIMSARQRTVPTAVTARLPRQTILGPVGTGLWSKLNLPDMRAYVQRGSYAQVEAADALAGHVTDLDSSP